MFYRRVIMYCYVPMFCSSEIHYLKKQSMESVALYNHLFTYIYTHTQTQILPTHAYTVYFLLTYVCSVGMYKLYETCSTGFDKIYYATLCR